MNLDTYYSRNKDKVAAYARGRYLKNREAIIDKAKAYYQLNKKELNRKRGVSRSKKRALNRAIPLKKHPHAYAATISSKYNLSWPQFTKLYEDQHGACAICLRPMKVELGLKKGQMVMNIDHDHNSGEVRGLLCRDCNRGLARFKDSKQILLKAVAYLHHPPFKRE